MDSQNIAKSLLERFQIPAKGEIPNRIIVWNDAEKSFVDEIDQIAKILNDHEIETVKVDLDARSYLLVKKEIELDRPTQKFLLYFTTEVPKDEDDWFLDTRLYGGEFHADKAALAMISLGLNRMSLRQHIANRAQFLANKRRITALKNFIVENDDEDSIDLKMIAVTVGAKNATVEMVLLKLLQQLAEVVQNSVGNYQWSESLKSLQDIEKFGLKDTLWRVIGDYFGYLDDTKNSQEKRSLNRGRTLLDLLLALISTELDEQIENVEVSQKYANMLITLPSGRASTLVFLDKWRDSREYSPFYHILVNHSEIKSKLGIVELFNNIDPPLLLRSISFKEADEKLIEFLIEELSSISGFSAETFEEIINVRSVGYWAYTDKDYQIYYELLQVAKRYIELTNHLQDCFIGKKIRDLYQSYITTYYEVDQLYRKYMTLIAQPTRMLRAITDLTEMIESNYINRFSRDLSRAWDNAIAADNFLSKWRIGSDPTQEEFFKKRVVPEKEEANLKRIYVIISDALRYEVAEELKTKINSGPFMAEISSQLGVVPSYTQLGMAALLPHNELSYKINKEGTEYSTTVMADGMSTAGLEARRKILARVNGIAFTADEFLSFNREAEKIARGDAEFIYIYHDTIDAIGDKLATESQTFKACEEAIEQLQILTRKIMNSFNGSRIIITADHGFIYQNEKLESLDKTSLRLSEDNHLFVTKKKRYVISNHQVELDSVWSYPMNKTLKTFVGDEYYIIPKQWNRFYFTGGARFVHGGISLQEIAVPIITVKNSDQATLEKMASVQYVQAYLSGVSSRGYRITSNISKIAIKQSERVSETRLARDVVIYIKDDEGRIVSNRSTLRLDSSEENKLPLEREVMLSLTGANFDRNKRYLLVIEDEKGIQLEAYSVTIDLAFADEFF